MADHCSETNCVFFFGFFFFFVSPEEMFNKFDYCWSKPIRQAADIHDVIKFTIISNVFD